MRKFGQIAWRVLKHAAKEKRTLALNTVGGVNPIGENEGFGVSGEHVSGLSPENPVVPLNVRKELSPFLALKDPVTDGAADTRSEAGIGIDGPGLIPALRTGAALSLSSGHRVAPEAIAPSSSSPGNGVTSSLNACVSFNAAVDLLLVEPHKRLTLNEGGALATTSGGDNTRAPTRALGTPDGGKRAVGND